MGAMTPPDLEGARTAFHGRNAVGRETPTSAAAKRAIESVTGLTRRLAATCRRALTPVTGLANTPEPTPAATPPKGKPLQSSGLRVPVARLIARRSALDGDAP